MEFGEGEAAWAVVDLGRRETNGAGMACWGKGGGTGFLFVTGALVSLLHLTLRDLAQVTTASLEEAVDREKAAEMQAASLAAQLKQAKEQCEVRG